MICAGFDSVVDGPVRALGAARWKRWYTLRTHHQTAAALVARLAEKHHLQPAQFMAAASALGLDTAGAGRLLDASALLDQFSRGEGMVQKPASAVQLAQLRLAAPAHAARPREAPSGTFPNPTHAANTGGSLFEWVIGALGDSGDGFDAGFEIGLLQWATQYLDFFEALGDELDPDESLTPDERKAQALATARVKEQVVQRGDLRSEEVARARALDEVHGHGS